MKTTKALSVSTVVLSVLCAGAISPVAQTAEPLSKPDKARVHGSEPCCNMTAINQATGVVTLKDLKTSKISQVTVTN